MGWGKKISSHIPENTVTALLVVTVLSLHYRFETLGSPRAARVGDEW